MLKFLLKRRGYSYIKKYNIYINEEKYSVVDGRITLFQYWKGQYKTHHYLMWTLYTNHKWSNDIFDTMIKYETLRNNVKGYMPRK